MDSVVFLLGSLVEKSWSMKVECLEYEGLTLLIDPCS